MSHVLQTTSYCRVFRAINVTFVRGPSRSCGRHYPRITPARVVHCQEKVRVRARLRPVAEEIVLEEQLIRIHYIILLNNTV